MTDQTYNLVATIYCKHNYFKDGVFKTIGFQIAEDSTKLIKDLGIVFKFFSGGFQLLASKPDKLALENPEVSLKIHFDCKDPYYINYTNIGRYEPTNDILYFSNLDAQFNSDEAAFLLHTNEYVGEKDIISVSEVAEHDSNSVWKKPLGILELFVQTLFNNYEGNKKANYVISFNTRYTILKYFLISEVFQQFDNLSIIQKDKGIAFNGPKQETIQQGNKVVVFESKNEIPLSEFSEVSYSLVNNYNSDLGPEVIVIKALAYASPEQLYRDGIAPNDKFYSHIYINL